MALSKQINKDYHGLKIRNIDQIDINLICESCHCLQHHPMQLLCCGIRLCRFCAKVTVPDSVPFVCPFCKEKRPKKEISDDRGLLRDLNKIPVECYACSWTGSYKNYLEHLEKKHADLKCSDCHEHFYTVHLYEEHRKLICEFRSKICAVPGCDELINCSHMKEHCLSLKHQMMIIKFITEYIFSRKYLLDRTSTTTKNKRREEMIFIIESIDSIQPGLESLLEDCTRLRTEHDQLQIDTDQLNSKIQNTIKIFNDGNEIIQKCNQLQDESLKIINEIKLSYEFAPMLSLDIDGTITFSFHKESEELMSSFSLCSSKFRTSPYGYVFILRVCSTIDSSNETKPYLSVYISLLRGEYDPILLYPFSYDISLSLCDQSRQNQDITTTIKASEHRSSFSRPTTEKNDEVGVINFCPLNYLTDKGNPYFKDDVFFVRILFNFIDFQQTAVT